MRVEPGEIEAALCKHALVQQATSMPYTDDLGEARLAAYFVATQHVAPNELRQFLKESLPDYMIPTVLMPLETMPTTPNGKIDRRALPTPRTNRTQLDVAYIPPQTQLEHKIASVWQDILGVAEVGIYDNFFDLGGHSLLLIEVQNKLQQQLSFPVTAVMLFQYPTIHTLAHHISQDQQKPQTYRESRDRAAMRRQALQRRQQNH
jgi:acyl carrier protein